MDTAFLCIDCRFDTFQIEYYMVKNDVWPIGTDDGMLCIDCLEKRIGRELIKDDFSDCLINLDPLYARSERLKSKLEMKKYIWWKEIVLGPFSDDQLNRLNWQNIEVVVDNLLENNQMPKTPPLSQDMKNNPNIPHVFFNPNEE